MLRILVMVLIAANLLYFGWAHWSGGSQPELKAVAAAPDAAKKAGAAAGPPPCATLGPFHDELLADEATKQLQKAGWRLQTRATSEQISDGWWVYVPNANAAAQARTLATIRGSGLHDAFAMSDDTGFRVSVGLFSDETRAEDRAMQVQRLRLDATVTERHKQQPVIWLDLPGVARETLGDGRLAATGLPLDQLRIEECPVPAPASQAGDDGEKQETGVAALHPGAGTGPAPRV